MLTIKYDARSVQQELNNLSEQLRSLYKVVPLIPLDSPPVNPTTGSIAMSSRANEGFLGPGITESSGAGLYWYNGTSWRPIGSEGIRLDENPLGTSYNIGSALPPYRISQRCGATDGWSIYGEGPSNNDIKLIFEIMDDIETGDTWVFRNKRTFPDYRTYDVVRISGEGAISAAHTIGNLDATNDIGQQMELGSTTMTTLRFDADNWRLWAGGTGGGQELFKVTQAGAATLKGSLTENASDERLKENITLIPNALDKVGQLRGVTFDWVDDIEEKGLVPSARHETGVIAQDVQRVIPDAVAPAPFDEQVNEETGETESISGEDYLTVKPQKIIPLLIEAIKELKAEVEELKANQ